MIAKGGLDARFPDVKEVLQRVCHRFTPEAIDRLNDQHIANKELSALQSVVEPLEAACLRS